MSAVSVARLVPVPAAVHQVRGARRPHVGVVERLEHRRRLGREMLGVHVVDRVGERPLEPERLRGPEARAVLDVARLAAVVPVHRRDQVAVRRAYRSRSRPSRPASPTGTRRRSRRRDGRAPSAARAPARGPTATARSSIAGFIASMTARTSFFGPPTTASGGCAGRRTSRRPGGGRPTAATRARRCTTSASGGNEDRQRRREHGDALGVDGQRRGRLIVEPAPHAAEQRARGLEAERRARDADDSARPPVASSDRPPTPAASERAEHERRRPAARRAAAADPARRGPRGARRGRAPRRAPARRAGTATPRGRRSPCPSKSRPDVRRRQRAGEQHRQERPDADRGRQPGALEEVEEEVHAR